MSEAVSPYFSKCGTKRNYPSTSDESDNSICSEASASSRQERKRLNAVVSEDDTDMAVQAALDKISQRLDTLATRTNVDQIKMEVKSLTQTFIEKLEKLEGRLFDTETKTDKTEAEVKAEKKKTEILTDTVKQQERRLRQLEGSKTTCSSIQDDGTCEYTRCPKTKQSLQTTVYRRYAVYSATKSASQSTLLTSRWLTGWDSGAAPGADP